MKKIRIVVCLNEVNCIGKDNELLYHISEDLKHFKNLTTNHTIIIGNDTLKSFPKSKPLPNRTNIVLTRNKDLKTDNVLYVHSIEDAIKLANEKGWGTVIYVAGGASIYKQFIDANLVDELIITRVFDKTEGDTYFPEYEDKFEMIEDSYIISDDEISYQFEHWLVKNEKFEEIKEKYLSVFKCNNKRDN